MKQFYLNDVADWEVDRGVYVLVRILEVKEKFGKFRYLIQPVEGRGTTWVENLVKANGNNK